MEQMSRASPQPHIPALVCGRKPRLGVRVPGNAPGRCWACVEAETLKPDKFGSWPEATVAAGGGARPSSNPVTTSMVFFTERTLSPRPKGSEPGQAAGVCGPS